MKTKPPTEAYRNGRASASAPQQKDDNNDHQYRTEATAKIMVGRAKIEATSTKEEDQNNQQQD
jgi:hypothetical protein